MIVRQCLRGLSICGYLSMRTKRIEIIPAVHGKLTCDGNLSEPDIYYILEKWLERHPTFKGREQEIRIVRGQWTLREGIRTEVITVSAIENEDIAGYDPAQDRDLYEYYLAEERYYQAGQQADNDDQSDDEIGASS